MRETKRLAVYKLTATTTIEIAKYFHTLIDHLQASWLVIAVVNQMYN